MGPSVGVVRTWGVGIGSVLLIVAVIVYGYRDQVRPADTIIVLGSGVEADGSPSKTLTVRAEHGASLYQHGIAETVICAGGVTGGAPRSEANACREELMRFGVPGEAILLEERSINTEQNGRLYLELMAERDLNSAVVVSSRYHLLRARWLFWRSPSDHSIEVVTSPARIDYLTPTEILYS
jgi:uncharacterized SAM-binding protein YcdF (DUF218 family)